MPGVPTVPTPGQLVKTPSSPEETADLESRWALPRFLCVRNTRQRGLAPDGSTKNQQAGPNQQPPEGATGNLLNSRSGDHPQSSMHPSLEQSLGT
jgi:hypothetical protein